ncbi:MAG: hypothetical protein WBK51_02450 [Polaromonas sp.]
MTQPKQNADHKARWNSGLLTALSLAGGFILSFAGLGVLWVGTPWPYQFLMAVPFFALSFVVTRLGSVGNQFFWLVICGATPIGLLITKFRDSNDSHLLPILTVSGWLAGVLCGYFLCQQFRRK